ncbi:MAG: hypothetical protein SVM80_05585 [Halobacteriota archaeon]|nr:hypothetical protein [Halobacteriota archaeon]
MKKMAIVGIVMLLLLASMPVSIAARWYEVPVPVERAVVMGIGTNNGVPNGNFICAVATEYETGEVVSSGIVVVNAYGTWLVSRLSVEDIDYGTLVGTASTPGIGDQPFLLSLAIDGGAYGYDTFTYATPSSGPMMFMGSAAFIQYVI